MMLSATISVMILYFAERGWAFDKLIFTKQIFNFWQFREKICSLFASNFESLSRLGTRYIFCVQSGVYLIKNCSWIAIMHQSLVYDSRVLNLWLKLIRILYVLWAILRHHVKILFVKLLIIWCMTYLVLNCGVISIGSNFVKHLLSILV